MPRSSRRSCSIPRRAPPRGASSRDGGSQGQAPAKRLIAVGDLHGSIDSFLEIASRLGIVGGSYELEMPATDLVFVGDVCDRGSNSRDIYALIIGWQKSAPEQGSRVWFLLGNHEVMNSYGLRHYNTAEEYLSFDASSMSAGARAHAEAFGPDGWLYRWLRDQQAIVRVGGLVFAHGDLPMALSQWEVEEINERVMDAFRGRRGGGDLPDPLFAPEKSILWCREAQFERPPGYREALEGFLGRNGACAYICGHTPSEDGIFHLDYGNRYLCIDTAMTFERLGIGRKSALVVEDGRAEAVYFEGGDVLRRELDLNLADCETR